MDQISDENKLIAAFMEGREQEFMNLLDNGYVPSDNYDGTGNTILYYIGNKTTLNMVKRLIENNLVNVNSVNNDGWSCLTDIAEQGACEHLFPIIKYLVDHSSKYNIGKVLETETETAVPELIEYMKSVYSRK